MRNDQIRKIVFTGLCIAIGLLLPKIINLLPIAYPGAIFLPMHIPVLICGFVCGLPYGVLCGMMLPLLSFLLTGMPPIFPIGISMVFELAAYGALTAIFYRLTKGKIFITLIIAMIGGRLVMGIANIILFSFAGNVYGITLFLTSACITALPGIIIQLIFIPPIVKALKKANMLPSTVNG